VQEAIDDEGSQTRACPGQTDNLPKTDQRITEMLPTTLVIVSILFALAVFYLAIFRPWQLRWVATYEEVKRAMPGDNIVDKPSFNATRVVTINAPAENIYPWIVQMGVNRAGWYSYDLLDNLAMRSAESILPEHQNTQVGDLIPMSPGFAPCHRLLSSSVIVCLTLHPSGSVGMQNAISKPSFV
jgi:hypothetical protein